MKKPKKSKKTVTITVRLTPEEHEVLQRLCQLKNTTQTACLAQLATRQARDELLGYAVQEYTAGRASLSELATQTGLDVPTIMDAVTGQLVEDREAQTAFLAAAKALSKAHHDPAFYRLAVKALND